MSSVKFATKDDIYKFIEPFNGKGLITSSGEFIILVIPEDYIWSER